MNTMKWLLRREYWEHRGSLFLAPLVVAGIMLLVTLGSLSHFRLSGVDGEAATMPEAMRKFEMLAPAKQQVVVDLFSNMYVALGAPILMLMAFTLTLFCLNSLYDERKDRSILFWKSLPVSDAQTVLSKAAMALVVAPLFSLAVALATALLQLVIICTFAAVQGVNFFGIVAGHPNFLLTPLKLVALLPVYALWALPTVGWLMLVSAWARGKVLAWAIGVPVLAGLLLVWTTTAMGFGWDTAWYWENVVARCLLGLVPGAWTLFGGIHTHDVLAPTRTLDLGLFLLQSWRTLLQPQLLIGAAAGCAMLYGAIRLRRVKEEG